jgi:AraC family L-rhamnose operon regulatory protein RhaS
MKQLIQHEPLVLATVEATTWNEPQPLRDHFALVSIRRGCGSYLVNNQSFRYQPGSLLLLGPADCYYFRIDQHTCFGILRFTDDYLAGRLATGGLTDTWQHVREVARHTALGRAGCLAPAADEPQLSALLAILFAEYGGQAPSHDALATSLVGAVLSLVGRQLAPQLLPVRRAGGAHSASVVQRVLAYIRRHIAEPARLRAEELASAFAYSASHLSELFRQETGESLRQYIVRYRLWLAETKLELSTLTISQIADELGFVDVCHLNKLFKKRYHLTPTAYRRQLLLAATSSPAQRHADYYSGATR